MSQRPSIQFQTRRNPRTLILFIRGSELALKPEDPEEIQVADGLFVGRVTGKTAAFLKASGVKDVGHAIGRSRLWIASRDKVENADVERPFEFFKALILCTSCQLLYGSMVTLEQGREPFVSSENALVNGHEICWGHYEKRLSRKNVLAAAALLPGILNSGNDYNYHRVGNALMFYMNGYNASTADFALLAFTTCLEGLFSTGEQELTFRLALRVAHFLGQGEKERWAYYQEMRGVYRNRSKLVHGAPIAKNTEEAAIQLVEGIVPTAEGLARESLRKVFELRLETLFSNGNRVDELFDAALFAASFKEALARMTKKGPE